MSKKLYEETNILEIANAIRTKNGTQNTYLVSEMAGAINNIPSPSVLIQKEINRNGTFYASDDNAGGYSRVDVNVQGTGSSEIIILDPSTESVHRRTSNAGNIYSLQSAMFNANQNASYRISISDSSYYMDGWDLKSIFFVNLVPKECNKLYIDYETTSTNYGSYPNILVRLYDAFGFTNTGDIYVCAQGTNLKQLDYINQKGLARQVHEYNISDITIDSWLNIYNCDIGMHIYKIWAD